MPPINSEKAEHHGQIADLTKEIGPEEVIDTADEAEGRADEHGSCADPEIAELLRLDGYTVLVEVKFYAAGLLLLLVEQVSSNHCSDGERTDDEVESIAIHRPGVLILSDPCLDTAQGRYIESPWLDEIIARRWVRIAGFINDFLWCLAQGTRDDLAHTAERAENPEYQEHGEYEAETTPKGVRDAAAIVEVAAAP
jgi:hypothetical protein